MSHSRTLWEEGREPGPQVVLLGVALVLSAAGLDVLLLDDVGWLFDICFVLACVAVALVVRPSDFFAVGVLPPLLMLGTFVLLGATRPDAIAEADDGLVQAVVSGLAHHAGALILGYALCLGVLAIRHRVLAQRALRDVIRPGRPSNRLV